MLIAQEQCQIRWWGEMGVAGWGEARQLLKCHQNLSEIKHIGDTVSLTFKSIIFNQI